VLEEISMIPTRDELIERLGGEFAADGLLDHFSNPDLEAYRPVLSALLDQGAWDLLADSFYQVMPFGTGGRRGPVGLGPNRFNPHNLATSVQGHVETMRDLFAGQELAVVVAFDVREFQDLRELYPRDVANPLLGWRSRDFARLAAEVYAANGVRVHMLDPEGEAFMSTPELSFAIRQLGANGGLNVSASHNHPDDNGGKFYNVHGGQEVPPQDERMVSIVEGVLSYQRVPFDEAVDAGRVVLMGPQMHRDYLDLNLAFARHPDVRDLRIVFSNLHGVGDQTAGEILAEAGFEVHMVPSQLAHDGSFPGAPFNAPNPEYPAALAPAEEVAREVDADLVLACDPDADRIGGLSHEPDGSWRFLTGNELTCLVVDFLLRGRQGKSFVITTEVTTGLFGRIARGLGAEVVDHLLVGCKYIAEIVRELEEAGRIEEFVMGCEESHGFLLSPAVRDKDSGGVALVLAEMAALEKQRGSSLGQRLGRIYKEFGPVFNAQVPLVMQGAAGKRRIEAIQAALRAEPPTDIGGTPVTAFFDRQDPRGVFGPIVSTTDAAARNVLVFHLGDRERVVIRPSGTEPKTKIYVEVIGEPLGVDASDEALDEANAAVGARAAELATAMTATALQRVDIELPGYAFAMSPLVSIEHRQDFCDAFLPELRRRVTAGEDVEAWIDGHLRPYGKGARDMVRGAVDAWLAELRDENAELAERIAAVF
jgi:phosphoglucomutase